MKIGILDSGIGGITVLKDLVTILPNHDYIYFGDILNVPYGNKTDQELMILTTNIIDFLIEQKTELIIIACGTISATILDRLQSRYSLPTIGIIEPTIKYIDKNFKTLGIMATPKSISSRSWEKSLNKVIPNTLIKQQSCQRLAKAIENNSPNLNQIIKEYTKPLLNMEAVILGCTHYPIVSKLIKSHLPHTKLINPSNLTAQYIKENFSDNDQEGEVSIYLSKIHPHTIDFITNSINKEITFQLKTLD